MPRVWHVNANQPHPWRCAPGCGMCIGTPHAKTGRLLQGHYYGDLFLQYGVALIGPGIGGAWPNFVVPWFARPGAARIVELFATGPAIGDIILLRPGTLRHIHAVGIVASGYQFLDQFDNVYGWDLQHARRVRWKPCRHDFGQRVFFPVSFSAVANPLVVQYAQQCIQQPPIDGQNGPLPTLPPGPLNLPPVPADG